MKTGSLFSGYGGLETAVNAHYGATTAWVSDIDKGACKILAHRYPGVPNLGDITTVDWSTVEPVDILTGGSPCQDLSHAGRRAGMTDGTRSNLWVAMREAIAQLRPSIVVWENVRGAYSAVAEGGTNGHELCLCGGSDRRRGVRSPRHPQADVPGAGDDWDDRAGTGSLDRSASRVGRDPSASPSSDGSLGGGLDVAGHWGAGGSLAANGAPLPEAEDGAGGPGAGGGEAAQSANGLPSREEVDRGDPRGLRGTEAAAARAEREGASCSCAECGGCVDASDCTMEPCFGCMGDGSTPNLRALGRVLGDLSDLGYDCRWHGLRAADVGAPHGRFRVFVVAADAEGNARRVEHRDREAVADPDERGRRTQGWDDGFRAAGLESRHRSLPPTPTSSDSNGAGAHGVGGPDLRTAIDLLPTPRATDGTKGGPGQRGSSGDLMLPSAVALLHRDAMAEALTRWGDYAAAIARWEHATGRPAPAPTMTNSKGNPQLSPAFVEWMMGLPAGWVTDAGVTRNEALKALGNGVVPQQAAEALRVMDSWAVAA